MRRLVRQEPHPFGRAGIVLAGSEVDVSLYWGSPPVQILGAALLFLGLLLDTVDGIVARRTGQSSLLGSVLDIAADRTYELVLWVCLPTWEWSRWLSR